MGAKDGVIILKQAVIIYNPTAGREMVKRHLSVIIESLGKHGFQAAAYATTGPGSATAGAREAAEQNVDLVVAAGGDGTVYEVINGLAELEYRPTLGLLPFGTTNDLARGLGIGSSVERACQALIGGREILVDIGKFNSRYFVNIAAGGALTELTYEVPYQLKTMIGQLAYYLKGFEKLPHIRPSWVRIEYDKVCFEGEIMMFLLANTNSVGGFERLAPRASIDDGMFDLLIIKKIDLVKFIYLAGEAIRGHHINDEHVIYAQASQVKIHVRQSIPVNLDGEFGGVLPGEFINLRHHLKMLVP